MLNLTVVEAATPEHLAQVAALLRDYLLWMRRRYAKHGQLIDNYFDPREWESELADLAGHYGAPDGAILLALVDGAAAGCVMLRGIGEDASEMKRLFVRPAFQDLGVAQALVPRLAELALARGYKTMMLETGLCQYEAQALYRGFGFQPIAPYHAVAGWFKDKMLFFSAATRDVARHQARRRVPVAA